MIGADDPQYCGFCDKDRRVQVEFGGCDCGKLQKSKPRNKLPALTAYLYWQFFNPIANKMEMHCKVLPNKDIAADNELTLKESAEMMGVTSLKTAIMYDSDLTIEEVFGKSEYSYPSPILDSEVSVVAQPMPWILQLAGMTMQGLLASGNFSHTPEKSVANYSFTYAKRLLEKYEEDYGT